MPRVVWDEPGLPTYQTSLQPFDQSLAWFYLVMRRIIMLHYKLCLVPAGVEQLGPVFVLRTSRSEQLSALDVWSFSAHFPTQDPISSPHLKYFWTPGGNQG